MFKKLRLGMIGGGIGSMIGSIHRHAALLDNQYELLGGAFNRNVHKSRLLGKQLGIKSTRIYATYEEMLHKEKNYPENERMEVIAIVIPNDLHFSAAKMALELGYHVIIDKPLSQFTNQARELERIAKVSKKLLCVTYVFTGYPMVKEARSLIHAGKLGRVRKVITEFSQGWLSTCLEKKKQKQAYWRMDPKRSPSGTFADIGTHAFHLAEYVTQLKTTHLCADVHTIVPERLLEDDGAIFLKFEKGVQGVLIASQIAAGEEANINLRLYAEKGSLHWQHSDPNTLLIKWLDQPAQLLRAGCDNAYLHDVTLHNLRTPAGHPEGYVEAFANHYRNFALCIHAVKNKLSINPKCNDYPKIEEGMRGVIFVERVLSSSKSKKKWLAF